MTDSVLLFITLAMLSAHRLVVRCNFEEYVNDFAGGGNFLGEGVFICFFSGGRGAVFGDRGCCEVGSG